MTDHTRSRFLFNAGYIYDPATQSFINDRNLYVSGMSFKGKEYGLGPVTSNSAAVGIEWADPGVAVMATNGTVTLATSAAAPSVPAAVLATADAQAAAAMATITVHISGDSWNGLPQFTLAVDGRTDGRVDSVDALHRTGQVQDIAIAGAFGGGHHDISIDYLNDANHDFSMINNSVICERPEALRAWDVIQRQGVWIVGGEQQ